MKPAILTLGGLPHQHHAITCERNNFTLTRHLSESRNLVADLLKLVALDSEDLQVISAHVQDAILRADGISYLPREKRLVLELRRFAWEAKGAKRWWFPRKERRLSALHFETVTQLRSIGIDRSKNDDVLSLLTVQFISHDEPGSPSGELHITFSGGGTLVAQVECVEAQLSDLGGAWAVSSRPRHSPGNNLEGGESG